MRPLRRLLTAATAAVALPLLLATPALAHVTVHGDAVAGSYATLTFQVPCESATAKTVAVTVTFPQDHPFASVSVRSMAGWTATVTKSKLTTPITDDDHLTITEAVSSITWRADASAALSLGQYAAFDVSVGPVPAVAALSFPTVQRYDDGSEVDWNQATPASGEEPDHPTPTLAVQAVPGGSGSGPSTGTGAATVTVTAAAAAPPVTAAGSDGTARALGVVGIVVGAVGVLAAALAWRRRPAGH